MKDVGSHIGVKNKANKYKMTKKQIYEKRTNLSKEKLNTINN